MNIDGIVMSEQSQKRPAHEVILRKLREILQQDQQGGGHDMNDIPRDFVQIATYSEVLSEMIIPEKARAEVLAELAQLAQLWDASLGSPDLPNMVRYVHDALSQEQ